ncbi:MAG: membrane integrity-associated transporter subunit PqiC [Proteobacteria bacterium]|nr:membrane integrity-associated transporter subunit PqiC [Pseudomonadota bacterium]
MSDILFNRRSLFAVAGAAAALSACSNLIGPPEPPPLYLLKPTPPPANGGPQAPWQLSIVLPVAPQSIDTDRIVILQPGDRMDFYANAAWQDRVPFLVQSALIDAFEADGRVKGIGRDTDGLKSDYLLESDIRDFQAQYSVADGIPTIEVRIVARLIAARGRSISSSLSARSEVQASENSIPAAVTAFNQALGAVIHQIVDWAATQPAPPKPQ